MIFHKLKDLQELEERVSRLKKHLEVDGDEALVISVSPMYFNHFVMDYQEVQMDLPQSHVDPILKDEKTCDNTRVRVSTNNEILL